MKKRLITGAVIMGIFVPLIAIDAAWAENAFLVLGMFLSAIASYEMMRVFETKSPSLKELKYIVPFFNILLIYTIFLSTTKGIPVEGNPEFEYFLYHFLVVVVFIAEVITLLAISILRRGTDAHDIMACITTVVYCGILMGYVISIRYISPLASSSYVDIQTTLKAGRSFGYVYTIVIITDSAAYLVGKRFGKRKLAPEISPNKSIEGAIGGLVAGTIVGTVSMFLYNIVNYNAFKKMPGTEPWKFIVAFLVIILVSLLISAAVQIGDLIASKIKRTYGVKDFGNIFPGHGGVLDRFDSLIFAGAFYYIIVQALQLLVLGAA